MGGRRDVVGGRQAVVLALTGVLALGCGAPGAGPAGAGPAGAGPAGAGTAEPVPVTGAPTAGAPAPPGGATPSRARAAVDAATSAAGRRDGVTLGVAVLDRATGATEVNAEGDRPLRAASVVKLLTTADVLEGRASGRIPADPADADLLRRALGPSDDAAMNVLWPRDGPGGVRRIAGALGLSATALAADPAQWGQTTMSARDATVVLAALAARPAPDRDFVIGALSAAPPIAADGFDQAFGLLDPATRGAAAAKQGWLCCLASSVDLNSVGLPDPAGRYVVALMSNQPYGYGAARDVLDEANAAMRAALDGT